MHTTHFENSAMKASFSLSSLPISNTPEKAVPKTREFNSLKKKRKESTKRLSWGSSASEQKDEFWSAVLEANYNYIMDNQLIDNCQDANCELSADSRTWSLKEFNAQFSELYSWLNRIQEKIYGHEDNVTDRTLRAHCKTKIIKKRPFYNIFNEQGNQLIQLYPDIREEVLWRLNHLNTKWESLESVLKSSDSEEDDVIDVQREVKCLRNWIRDMELRLQPLTFQRRWSKTEIETKAIEHKVLHKDIENHGKIVSSVVKLCRRTSGSCRTTLNIVTGLERRWHLLFLRSMEWQCYIENYIKRNSALFSDSDSDEGPAKKQPRLSTDSPDWHECLVAPDAPALEDEIDGNGNNANNAMNNPTQPETGIPKPPPMSGLIEDAQFTKSNRNAPNFGTYYFKHVDTDSDMEKLDKLQNIAIENDGQTTSETSEEEWVYTAGSKIGSPQNSKLLEMKKIFQEVEDMVSPIKRTNPTGQPPLNKTMRIKQWLKNEKPDDSCDASSEEDENESSESSEELNESIATYRPQTSLNASCLDLDLAISTPKVTMRQRYNARSIKGQRPSSIACITQLSKSNRIEHDSQTYSISESALHKLSSSTQINMRGNNSTSSTVEDSCAMVNEETNSPLRRKRFKLKKKASVFKKLEATAPFNGARITTLVKSGSFSGRSCIAQLSSDRHTVSDPSAISMGPGFETSTTSGADSDEDKRSRRMPVFKIGASTSYGLEGVRDDSPGKFSLNTNEEQTGSLCDEAWDSYQEKYSSEAYSEAHDSDAARKLLEFGEDYRTYLGSQSDWSTQSSHLESPQFPRKFFPMNIIDSDNEASNLRQQLKDSRAQFEYTTDVYMRQHTLGLNQFLVNNDVTELVATCDRHIGCLSQVEKSPDEYKLPLADKKEFSDLIASWNGLRARVVKMQEYRDLQNELLQLKRQLCDIKMPAAIEGFIVNTIEDLSRDIDFYSAELASIEEQKKRLLRANVSVNHFMTENADYAGSSLKSDVSELYRIWNEINNRATDRVNRLNVLLQTWQVLENRLDQLRGDLRDDEQTLVVLDTALQGGTFSNQMASSVRGVAKLLSETKTEGCSFSEMFFTEGSFSDSGISDEGSEHDIGERERRLSAIRRLVRQLEIVMAPDCSARVRMRERLAAAEEELKSLQNKCRSIIVRTAVSAAAPLSESVVAAGPGGDPDEEPTSRSWFKRVIRASVSFQFAIMALLFVACLLEPHCCDNMNNLQLSMNPQLHYVRGPPPI